MANNIRLESKILMDGGDPAETLEAKKLLGHIDGQTTNPTLISKNPEVAKYLASGKKLTHEEAWKRYEKGEFIEMDFESFIKKFRG